MSRKSKEPEPLWYGWVRVLDSEKQWKVVCQSWDDEGWESHKWMNDFAQEHSYRTAAVISWVVLRADETPTSGPIQRGDIRRWKNA